MPVGKPKQPKPSAAQAGAGATPSLKDAPAKTKPTSNEQQTRRAGAGGRKSTNVHYEDDTPNAGPEQSSTDPGAEASKADQRDANLDQQPAGPGDEDRIVSKAKGALKRAGEASWEAADAFLELEKRGWKQQRIADVCGVHQGTVSRFLKCAKKYALAHKRPSFWEAYREVGGHTKTGAGGGDRRFTFRLGADAFAKFEEMVAFLMKALNMDDLAGVIDAAVSRCFQEEYNALTQKEAGNG